MSLVCRVIVIFHLAIGTCCGFYGLLTVYGVTCDQIFDQVVVYITVSFITCLFCEVGHRFHSAPSDHSASFIHITFVG